MNRYVPRCVMVLPLVVGLTSLSATAQDSFLPLVLRVPSTANALAIFNVDKILNSPLGLQEDWKLEQEAAFESGMIILPPNAVRFVLASEFDLGLMEPRWEIAVMQIKDGPTTKEIATRAGTKIDNIVGAPSVPIHGDAYVVKFDYQTYGAIAPASRQNAANWIRQSRAKKEPTLTPYLMEAVGYSEQVGTEVIQAIDLTDVLPPDFVLQRLKEAESLQGQNVDLEALAEVVTSLRGVTLGIMVGKNPTGSIRIDFAQDASIMRGFAKPLILEALGGLGAMIDDFQAWDVSIQGKSVMLSGDLSETGRRQVLSVVDARTSMFVDPGQGVGGSKDPTAEATLRYFKSVDILLSDLEGLRGKAQTWSQKGIWFEKYARKIDGLSMLNVDPQMLDYGAYVSSQVRAAAAALKGIGPKGRLASMNTPTTYNTRSWGGAGVGRWSFGWHGGTSYVEDARATLNERSRNRARIKIQGNAQANSIMGQLEGAKLEIRRAMTEKYQIEF